MLNQRDPRKLNAGDVGSVSGGLGGVDTPAAPPPAPPPPQARGIDPNYFQNGYGKYGDPAEYFDRPAYNYGNANYDAQGNLTTAGVEDQRLLGQIGAAQGRQGVDVDYTVAKRDRGMELDSRDEQMRATGLLGSAAMGTAPSFAEQSYLRNLASQQGQFDNQLYQNQAQFGQQLGLMNAAANSAAASTRGGGSNLALAQRTAANAQAQGLGALAQQQAQTTGMMSLGQAANAREGAFGAGAMRAQEMADARGQYAGASQALRGQDADMRGLSANMAQFQAGLYDQQRGRNDQMQMGYEGLRQGFNQDQQRMGAQRNMDANQMALEWERTRRNLDAARMQRDTGLLGAGINAAASVIGGVAGAFGGRGGGK